MPPAGGLDGIRNNRRRPAAFSLDLAKRAESARRESFLELATVTLNYYIQLHMIILIPWDRVIGMIVRIKG